LLRGQIRPGKYSFSRQPFVTADQSLFIAHFSIPAISNQATMPPPETEPGMDWDVNREVGTLQRIVALLLALANLAERAAAVPFAQRVVVLAILRHAETAAWSFALGTLCISTTSSGRNRRRPQDATLSGPPVGGDDGPADLARLASSLRMLALLIAGWAIKALSLATLPLPVRGAMTLTRPGSRESWQGPVAPSAPDTS
jgi:hypothetical protein